MGCEYDVIIVGGGLSGLTVARTVVNRRPGTQVVIVEAKERIGGRILTQTFKVKFEIEMKK